ncbi:hypothetical protein ACLK1X_19975 [Escherichia coli]
MTFSLFGDKFTRHSGITLLMEDLNDGLRTPGAIMLGGGNPADPGNAGLLPDATDRHAGKWQSD